MNKEAGLFAAFLAFAIVIISRVWFAIDQPLMNRLIDSLYWLAVSYVPGYFVYLSVAYFPMKRDRQLLAPFIARESEQVPLMAMALLRDLNRVMSCSLTMNSRLVEIEEVWVQIDRESIGPAIKKTSPIVHCTWMEVIYDYNL